MAVLSPPHGKEVDSPRKTINGWEFNVKPFLPLAAVVLFANVSMQLRLILAAILSNFRDLNPICVGYEECWPDTLDAVFDIRMCKLKFIIKE